MVKDLILLPPSSPALCSALWVLFISPVGRSGEQPTTLTPEVMFIEKKKKHTDPGKTCEEVPGEGALEASRGPDIALVNEVL